MSGAGWDFVGRRVAGEVEVLASAFPSGASYLVIFSAQGRVRRAAFLGRPGSPAAPRDVLTSSLPGFVLGGATQARGDVLGGW